MIEPSPEVKNILKSYCKAKRAELGPNWKEITASKMAEETTQAVMPFVEKLRELKNGN
jgi:hypothetical protein